MSQPQLKLELALSTRPTEAPTWVDVTRYLRGPISLRRGGSRELNRFETGRLDAVLDNSDRRFDASYEGELANAILNPSFEGGDDNADGIGNDWYVDASHAELAGQYACSLVTPGLGGSYAQQIVVSPLSGLTAERYLLLRTAPDVVTVDDTQDWVFRAKVRLSGLTGSVAVRLFAWWYNAAHGYLTTDASSAVTTEGEHQLEATWTPPAGAAYVQYMVQLLGLHDGDAVTLTVDQCQVAPATIDAYVDGDNAPVVVNLIPNPSFEGAYSGGVAPTYVPWNPTGTSNGSFAESTEALYGAKSQRITKSDGGAGRWGVRAINLYAPGPFSGTTVYQAVSFKVLSYSPGAKVIFYIDYSGGPWGRGGSVTIGPQHVGVWTQIASTAVPDAGDTANVHVGIEGANADILADGLLLSETGYDYTDGDQPMCGWLGIPHASQSVRYAQQDCHWESTPHASRSYRGGPYYGQLKPMRRARLSATWGGGLYAQFTGYIEGWPSQWDIGNYRVQLKAQDGFEVISGGNAINDTYPEELTGERVNRVLDAVGWTTGTAWILDSASNSQLGTTTVLSPTEGDRAVMLGQTTVQGETLEDVNPLAHLHDVCLAENGLLFVSKGGALTFHDRHYRLKPVNQTSKATFGDAAGELPFVSFVPVYDRSQLYNEVQCTRKGGTMQTASDAAAKLEYFVRKLPETDLLATTDAEMADRANWMLSRRKDPRWRMDSLTIDPEGDDALWPVVLGLELGDRITVHHRPRGGQVIGGDYWIRQISIDIDEEFRWRVVYGLSPAETTLYWHISDGTDEYAPFAVLGTSTVLAY